MNDAKHKIVSVKRRLLLNFFRLIDTVEHKRKWCYCAMVDHVFCDVSVKQVNCPLSLSQCDMNLSACDAG